MSAWSLVFSPDAQKDFAKLDKSVRVRLLEKLEWFSKNFDSLSPLLLTGEYREFCKLRVGDWRIFYTIDTVGQTLMVKYIDHRSRAYRKRKGK